LPENYLLSIRSRLRCFLVLFTKENTYDPATDRSRGIGRSGRPRSQARGSFMGLILAHILLLAFITT
jgi:hypothetical protein